MGKITPRSFLILIICGLVFLSGNTAFANINYGPEKPVALSTPWYESPMGIFVFNLDDCTNDIEDPTIIVQNITINLDSNGIATITASDIDNGSSDNCGITSRTLSETNFSCSDMGQQSVWFTATDAKGNSAFKDAIVTVEDNIVPNITAPADKTASTNDDGTGDCTTSVALGSPTSSDNCEVDFTKAYVDGSEINPSTFKFPIGSTTVTWEVTDKAGIKNSDTQTVTVNDNEAPSITAPADTTANTDDDGTGDCTSTVVLGSPTSSDNCEVDFTKAYVDGSEINPSTFKFPIGSTTVTWEVTDKAGIKDSDTQTVTLNDNEAPSITAPADKTANTNDDGTGDCTSTVVLGSPTSSDNCEVDFTKAYVDGSEVNPSTFKFPIGSTTVTWEVTDKAGIKNSDTQTVIVSDNEDPTASNPAPVTVQCTADVPAPDPLVVIDETDNCTSAPIVAFVSDVSDNNSNPEIITRTYSVSDEAGNSIEVTQQITVDDTINPTASNPAPVTVQCTVDVPAPDPLVVIDETDNCTSAPIVAFVSDVSDNNSNPEIITRTYSVSDEAGNSINVTQKITVDDTINPTASNPAPVNVQCTADVPTTNPSVVIDEADNCTSNPTVAFVSDSSDGNSNPEVITRTYSVTDEAGNSIDVTQEITVNDTTDPTASNPAPVNVQCTADVPATDPSVVIDEADNCTSNPTVAFVSDVSDNNSNPEIITRTYSVTDEAGNSIEVTQQITVDDTIDPTASNPAPVNVQCTADVPAPDPSVVIDETDNCTSAPIVAFVSDVSDNNSNPEIITRTYSVTDEAGNSINVTQKITVDDTTDPNIPELEPITSECSITITPPTTTDNCDSVVTGTTGLTDLTFDDSGSIFWYFTDAAGNEIGPIEQKVIIDNTVAPEPDVDTLPTKTITGCQISSISDLDIPTATDFCEGTISGTLSEDFEFPYIFTGKQIIEWEFTDSQGNTSTQQQEIILSPEDVNGGTLNGTFESSVFQDQIDITSCEEEISIQLQLAGETGTIIHWEKFAVNEGTWEEITNNNNIHTATFPIGALESTYYRVLIQVGTCTEYSNDFYIRALPTGAAPTVENLDPDNKYCLGEEVNLLAKSNYLVTQDAIPNSSGDFDQGQLNTQDPNSWLVDGEPGGFTAGGNAVKPRNWSGTNNHNFGGIEYDSQDKKFTIAYGDYGSNDYNGNKPTTLESPIMDLSNAETASLDFDQAFYFANNDFALIEISLDGGTTYETLSEIHAAGSGVKSWFTAGTAESIDGSTATQYNFNTDNTSISLEDYLGENNVRIRWSFIGTSDKSVWAMDNIFLNNKVYVETELEWTEGIGDPDEDPIETGSTEVPYSFAATTPGIQEYGGTALVNGCRTYGEEGTGLVDIYVSYSYAGEDIIFTNAECGQNTVQLNAYDNTISANENIAKGAYPSPPPGCKGCDAPGTGDIGEWSWTRQEGTSSCITESFSDEEDPNATFTAGPGTYTLTWTVNGCSNDMTVKITDCELVDFDGVDDHVDFSDNYDLNGDFSLEVWVKPESIDGTRTIFSKRDTNYSGTAKGYDLRITDGIVSFNWDKSGTIASPHSITTNRWYHIAVTHTGAGEYSLYIDGIRMKVDGGDSPDENNYRAILGAMDTNEPNVASNYFDGWMEELRIWNVALTPDQLHLMMNQRIEESNTNEVVGEIIPINIPSLDWNDLVGYYRMDDIDCGNINPHLGIGVPGKLKNITSPQERTAPLPYISVSNGTWRDINIWQEPEVWDPPNSDGINGDPINWNIAEISHTISSGSEDIYLLGLLSEENMLTIANDAGPDNENNSGQGLTISHYLRLNGNIDLVGESQLVQNEGSILDESSSGYLERDQQGTENSFNYNYWTSPVSAQESTTNSGYIIKNILKDGTDSNNPQTLSFEYPHTHADGDYNGNKRISTYWLHKFHGTANVYGEWRWIGANSNLEAAEGFTMKGTSGLAQITDRQNYVFRGKPNNGTIMRNISDQENRLLGNPYPSAIDADQFIRDNLKDVDGGDNSQNIFNGALYFWDHFGAENTHVLREYVGGYATYTLAGGVEAASTDSRINATGDTGNKAPGRYIPVAQGFFVNSVMDADIAGNYTINGGDVEFRNRQRVFVREDDGGDSQFLRPENLEKGKQQEKQAKYTRDTRYKIRLNFHSPKGYHRQILVTADSKTTNQFDLGYDAPLIDNNVEDMFWMMEKSQFVIQAVPNFNLDQELPIGLKIAEEDEFKIEIGELENVPDIIDIYLRDNSDSTYHDLRKEAFKATLPAGEYQDLYAIVFHDVTSTKKDKEPGEGPIDYYYSLENREFVISNPELHKIEHINIYNITGQLVDQHFGIPDMKEIHISQKKSLSSAVYIVKVYTSAGDYAKKVIIRKD